MLPRIRRAAQVTPLARTEVTQLHQRALSDLFAQLVNDDVLTKQEDALLTRTADALEVQLSPDEARRYIVAACNAGLTPRDPEPQILLNQGEIAYSRISVALLSARVIKEYRTNYQSLSVPIGHTGMRYRTGHSRGRQVVVGTKIDVADRGWLSVTSQRIVFSGRGQAMEFPLRRLVGLSLFGDGLGLQITNRKSVPTFRTGAGTNEMIAAIIGTAASLERGTFVPPQVAPIRPLALPPMPSLLAKDRFVDQAPTLVTTVAPPDQTAKELSRGQGPITSEVRAIFEQLDKFPGQREELTQMKTLYQLGGGSRKQLEALLNRCHQVATQMGLPPALTPYPLARLPLPERPATREVPDQLAQEFLRLGEFGLTQSQLDGLREDYRSGSCRRASAPRHCGCARRVESRQRASTARPVCGAPVLPAPSCPPSA